jgi:di/tricarboxylate transporter
MTLPGWITLAIIGLASLMIMTGKVRPDLTALLVAVSLGITGVLTPAQAFSGFSQSAVITILSLFVLTSGLEKTGVTQWLGRRLLGRLGHSTRLLTAGVTLGGGILSLFMNSVAAAAVLLPATMGLARRVKIPPSRLLMPLAFGTLLGGTATLLTTANIIASTTLSQAGFQPFGLLEFLPVGLPLLIAGTLLILAIGPRLLPARDVAGSVARMSRLENELAQLYHLRESTREFQILPASKMAGHTLREGRWGEDLGVIVLGILHNGRLRLAPDRDTEIQVGDVVLVDGVPTQEEMDRYGLAHHAASELAQMLATTDYPLVEVILTPHSELEGQTLRDIRFRERYGIQALALWREGQVRQAEIADIPLRFGDAMLMQGPREQVELLATDPNFLLLEEETEARPSAKAPLSVLILLGALVLAGIGALPISLAALSAVALMVLTGCIKMEEAYRAIEWKAIFLIAGMLPISVALQTTGTAKILGEMVAATTGNMGPLGAAAVLLLVTIGISLLLGGQAAAVILAPIAIAVAALQGVDPHGLVMAVAVGCSMAFLSPLGHPSNLLVMGPGGYTFRDYTRLGIPLAALSVLVALVGLHWFWGL